MYDVSETESILNVVANFESGIFLGFSAIDMPMRIWVCKRNSPPFSRVHLWSYSLADERVAPRNCVSPSLLSPPSPSFPFPLHLPPPHVVPYYSAPLSFIWYRSATHALPLPGDWSRTGAPWDRFDDAQHRHNATVSGNDNDNENESV